jgi:hypothetical protein
MQTPSRLPKRTRPRPPQSKHIQRSNHFVTLALVVLVGGTVATAGVHFLSPSSAATGPKKSTTSGDITAPTASFTEPATGSVTGKAVLVTIDAHDETRGSGMSKLVVSLDGSTAPLKAFDGDGPYSFVWDSSTVASGSHTLSAIATDKAGNNSTALLTVIVK